MTKSIAYTTLVAAAIGAIVNHVAEDGTTSKFTVAKLDDKLGKIKPGEDAQYLVLQKEGDETAVVTLHPKNAQRLLKSGEDGEYKLEAPIQLPEAAPAAEGAEATAEPKEPSKKELTVAMFKEMSAAGAARKDIIAKMKSDLGMSAACANTYYQNCKSGAWA